jgi:hypothetical protein
MELCEGTPNPSSMGPVEIVRSIVLERNQDGLAIRLTGPRGGLQEQGQFSEAAMRAFLTRLFAEL